MGALLTEYKLGIGAGVGLVHIVQQFLGRSASLDIVHGIEPDSHYQGVIRHDRLRLFGAVNFLQIGQGAVQFALEVTDPQKAFYPGEHFKFVDGFG